MVLWHGRSCKEMRGEILRTCEWNNRGNCTKSQHHAWMIINLKKKKNGLSTVCSQIVLKCLYFTRIGRPDVLRSVNTLARAVTKWTKTFDKRLNRLISYIHHTCEYWHFLLCGKHSTTLRMRIVSRLWFRRRPWRLEVNIRRNSLHFRKSHVRTNKLDVQETDLSFIQFHGSWNYFSRCRFTHGWDSRPRTSGFSGWILHQPKPTKPKM